MDIKKYCISSDATIIEALQKIELNNQGFICVIDQSFKLLGVLTDGDIRRELIRHRDIYYKLNNFIDPTFEFLNKDSTFDLIVEKFKDEKITFLPIIDDDKKLINILKKNQLHDLLLKGETLDLNIDFSDFDKAEAFEIYNRPWGFYKTVVLSNFVQAKVIQVFPEQQLSLQYHKKREEHWIVIKGTGKLTIGESEKEVYSGSYIFIPKGCEHRIKNTSKEEVLIISEVQLGEYFGEDDIIRIEDNYGRI